jgi:hypothetical protein
MSSAEIVSDPRAVSLSSALPDARQERVSLVNAAVAKILETGINLTPDQKGPTYLEVRIGKELFIFVPKDYAHAVKASIALKDHLLELSSHFGIDPLVEAIRVRVLISAKKPNSNSPAQPQ